jgi:hypothetical protein
LMWELHIALTWPFRPQGFYLGLFSRRVFRDEVSCTSMVIFRLILGCPQLILLCISLWLISQLNDPFRLLFSYHFTQGWVVLKAPTKCNLVLYGWGSCLRHLQNVIWFSMDE